TIKLPDSLTIYEVDSSTSRNQPSRLLKNLPSRSPAIKLPDSSASPSLLCLKKRKKEPVAIAPGQNRLSDHAAIHAFRSATNRFPKRETYDLVIEALGDTPDVDRLRACFAEWSARGFNPTNLAWCREWYPNGIPPNTIAETHARKSSNARN